MKVYQLIEIITHDTGPDWTSNYRTEKNIIATYSTRDLVEKAIKKKNEKYGVRCLFVIAEMEVIEKES